MNFSSVPRATQRPVAVAPCPILFRPVHGGHATLVCPQINARPIARRRRDIPPAAHDTCAGEGVANVRPIWLNLDCVRVDFPETDAQPTRSRAAIMGLAGVRVAVWAASLPESRS